MAAPEWEIAPLNRISPGKIPTRSGRRTSTQPGSRRQICFLLQIWAIQQVDLSILGESKSPHFSKQTGIADPRILLLGRLNGHFRRAQQVNFSDFGRRASDPSLDLDAMSCFWLRSVAVSKLICPFWVSQKVLILDEHPGGGFRKPLPGSLGRVSQSLLGAFWRRLSEAFGRSNRKGLPGRTTTPGRSPRGGLWDCSGQPPQHLAKSSKISTFDFRFSLEKS